MSIKDASAGRQANRAVFEDHAMTGTPNLRALTQKKQKMQVLKTTLSP
jgi:hypothetical protein